ncbi:pyridoxal phosphate-dependent aminotransferase [Mechercharimyces sp. CAU 1602]|uniref:pyridoxal phosphate-dependent aminotransferase n=1 Tax=Mechercharimyces sp. CAU 1602 TaxID=2973933 RepID=UPI002163F8C1|nr:pyridoxal phosphate-dependent aminotransferase [Mechercharimyces sp. CAU 1602]MCS1351033.1 pyridoxal phosphate-dependent aminotransferase [Mechercharimyces sp. CAU 1602]
MQLSKRVQQVAPSVTLTITAMARALKDGGKDVVGLGAGEPDFNTPQHIIEAAIQAMNAGHTKYTPASGIASLKEAIIRKFHRDNRLQYTANQVMVTVGAKHALYNLFQALLDPGDEVIIPTPYWVSYVEQVKLAGGVPVLLEGKEEDGFKISTSDLAAAVTERTKAFLINSPSNPTGAVYTKEELTDLGRVCIDQNVTIISDEIYEHLIYSGQPHISMASLGEEYYNQTVIINGVSKTYSMTGWRIGYVAGNADLIQAMSNISSHSTSNPASIAQYAAIAALEGPQEPVATMRTAFAQRRDFLVAALQQLPGISASTPAGAFYVYANIAESMKAKSIKTSAEWAQKLLEEELVAVVPGSAFGTDEHVRLSYATSMEQLEKAVERIKRFVDIQ